MSRKRTSLRGGMAALILLAGVSTASAACRAPLEPWTEISLYFGRDIAGLGEVGERQFKNFLSGVVTPRFPDGLSVIDADGQFRDGKRIVRERAKLVIILVPSAAQVAPKLAFIAREYKARFRQQSVLHTETRLCLSFD